MVWLVVYLVKKSLILFVLLGFSHGPAVAGYNAIYFAPKNNIVGASYGQETKKAATSKARKQCKSRGGRGCKKVMWSNRCSSLYVSPGSGKYGYGAASGESRANANKNAYKQCRKSNFYCVRRIAACEDAYEDK